MLVDRKTAVEVSAEIQVAVSEILAKYGMDAGKVATKYGDFFSIKIDATPIKTNENGANVNSVPAQEWMLYGNWYGFDNPESVLGATFFSNGMEYRFTGLNRKASKFPVCAEQVATGKSYKMGVAVLKKLAGFDASKTIVDGLK